MRFKNSLKSNKECMMQTTVVVYYETIVVACNIKEAQNFSHYIYW